MAKKATGYASVANATLRSIPAHEDTAEELAANPLAYAETTRIFHFSITKTDLSPNTTMTHKD